MATTFMFARGRPDGRGVFRLGGGLAIKLTGQTEVDPRAIQRHVLPRMAGWNETTLRSAASWKAFKDGKALLESGAVSAVKTSADLCSGTVREGKRVYK